MAVHHVSPHEKKAKARKRAKHPHRTVIEHLKKGGHVVTHEYGAADGEPAYGPGFEDKQAFEDKPSLMTHLASAIPGSGGTGGGAATDDGDGDGDEG